MQIHKKSNGNKQHLDLLAEIQALYHEVAQLDIKLKDVSAASARYRDRACELQSKYQLQREVNEELRQQAET